MKFINLHHHDQYSMLDGWGKGEQIVERLSELKQSSIAITNHGNIYSHIPSSKIFKEANMHLVYGCEMYIVNDAQVKERGYFHITVLAKTNEGYQNLLKLVNLSYKQFYYKPRIGFKQLLEYNKGLIVLSGCCNDGFLIRSQELNKKKLFEAWIKAFKNVEWYVELQPFFPDEKEKWDLLTDMAKKFGLPCVVTLDSHYLRSEDKKVHEMMIAINTAKPLSSPDLLKMEYPLYLAPVEEIVERCKQMGTFKEEWITNTYDIAMSCKVELPKTEMLKIGITKEDIRKRCYKALKERNLHNDKVYVDRLERELKMIDEKGFNDYFGLVADFVVHAKEHMLVGSGRGSSAGSLVCWLLHITEVDPIRHKLLFERFIDPSRKKDLPDIDLDFPSTQRDEVIDYLINKYGIERTARFITFGKFKPRAIIQDAARVLEIPRWEASGATSQMIDRSGGDARSEFCLADSINQYDKLKALFQKYPKMYDAINLEGQIRQSGSHAAGVAISKDPIETIGSINEDGILGIDKHSAEGCGLMKIDILGLETLDVVQDVCKEVGFDYQQLYDLPLDDKLTYERVFVPSKLWGIFQFEGLSVKQINNAIKPTTFEQLTHVTALGRPGALESGNFVEYIERFRGKKYEIDPYTEPYTSATLGVVIFQEQVMNVVRHVGGFDDDGVVTIRKIMSKKFGEESFNKYKKMFIDGAAKKGLKPDHAERIWDSIVKHSNYGFCLHKDTKITIAHPNKHFLKYMTIEELYQKCEVNCNFWYRNCKIKGKDGQWRVRKPKVLSFYSDGRIKPQRIKNLYQSGLKLTYEMKLENGCSVKASLDHKFLTDKGWMELKDIKVDDNIMIDGGIIEREPQPSGIPQVRGHGQRYKGQKDGKGFVTGINNPGYIDGRSQKLTLIMKRKGKNVCCEECRMAFDGRNFEYHHVDGNKLNNIFSNIKKVCYSCHRKLDYKLGKRKKTWSKGHKIGVSKVVAIKRRKYEMTYDIEMEDNPNFIAEGIVTHNCEAHAVSYALLSYWTAYFKAHYPEAFYARILKFEAEEDRIRDILKEYGGKFIALDINKSKPFFHYDKETKELVGGFTNVKGVGEKVAKGIVKGQPYHNLDDFADRNNKTAVKFIIPAIEKGLGWADLTSIREKVKDKLGDLKFSVQLLERFSDIKKSDNYKEVIILGKVVHVNLKDANEEVKAVQRGYKVQGFSEYIVLKTKDDDGQVRYLVFDRKFTEKNKQQLLDLKDKICVFKVKVIYPKSQYDDHPMLLANKFKVLV